MFRKDIESVYKTVFEANEIVQTLLTDDMKMELNEQVFFVARFTRDSDPVFEQIRIKGSVPRTKEILKIILK